MRFLVFEWATGTYTYEDVSAAFDSMGIEYHTVSYEFDDKNEDDFFEWRFGRCIKEGKYDAVYSTNYFPLVSKCCMDNSIPYISWSYDNPLDVPDIEKTLGNPCNKVFLFDRIQVEGYRKKGFDNVYHLPLAANVKRLDRIKLTSTDERMYSSEISFVGKLYQSQLGMLMSGMDDYSKGYIDALVEAQSKIYGYYMVDELLTDEFVEKVTGQIRKSSKNQEIVIPKSALSYAIGTTITRKERILLLKLLSMHHQVKLYSREENELLDRVEYMGSCGYLNEMPKIFKASKVNLNINLKVSQSGIPLRVMDVFGCGGFLISNYQIEIAENFIPGREVVLYESIEDAYEKVDYYLKHEDVRRQIAGNAYVKVRDCFSYETQIGKMLEASEI